MDKELLKRKNELVTSEIYKAIREEQLNAIVKLSTSQASSDYIRGMLIQIAETDKWQSQYENAIKKAKEDKEE